MRCKEARRDMGHPDRLEARRDIGHPERLYDRRLGEILVTLRGERLGDFYF